jgi:asparagine synthetase B (glutamine-hydrolysing)
MCGIGGFSLVAGSSVDVQGLAGSLLSGLERRGAMASGFAWQSVDGSGYFKAPVAGSKLSLKALPFDAQSVILHTRLATHGSVNDNRNNHPVLSPDQSIALVHNGVIYNHDVVREHLSAQLPAVDTAVIPAIIEQHSGDVQRFDMLDGDAAVAWLDSNELGVLRVARVSHSPLFIAQDVAGSFFFASTEDILRDALKSVGVIPVFVSVVDERTLLEVRSGVVSSLISLPSLSPEFSVVRSNVSSFRAMTAGASRESAFGVVEDDYSAFGLDADFEAWLRSFYFVDGVYFDDRGVFVGTRDSLREEFDEWGWGNWFEG